MIQAKTPSFLLSGVFSYCVAMATLPAASLQETAAGFVNLYFGSPLLAKHLKASDSWSRYDDLSVEEVAHLTSAVWNAYAAREKEESARGFSKGFITLGERRMEFSLARRGTGSASGVQKKQPVTLSLHGGGDVSKEANDRQWRIQQHRYPDVPGLYVCPRAPRDTWDQWHAEHVDRLIEKLIQQLLVHEEVDPRRIYLMGYSSGGYGAFSLGANMPDRFGAVGASAAAPTPGTTPVEHWQHLPLRFEVGEEDRAYGRIQRCRAYDHLLQALRHQHRPAFEFVFIEHSDQGHQIADQGCTSWLGEHERQHRPKQLTWMPSGSYRHHYYWLTNDEPGAGQRIQARIEGNQIVLETKDVHRLRLRLDDQLVDLDQPVSVYANGMKLYSGTVARKLQCLVQTLEERGDPDLMYCSEIELYIP